MCPRSPSSSSAAPMAGWKLPHPLGPFRPAAHERWQVCHAQRRLRARPPMAPDEILPDGTDYTQVLKRLQNCRIPDRGVLNFGFAEPIFVNALPADFNWRMGLSRMTPFLRHLPAGGYRIGYLRIPTYGSGRPDIRPQRPGQGDRLLSGQHRWTDCRSDAQSGRQVDYANSVLSYLIPTPWTAIGFEVRATSEWVLPSRASLESAKAQGAPAEIIALSSS